MVAQNRRIMTYKKGDYYIDIVTKEKMYEAWIYKDSDNWVSPKFYMFGMPKRQQDYFTFYEIARDNLDEYKYMCDANVTFPDDDYEPDYSENMPCDNSGICAGSSCSNYPKCQGWTK